MKRWGVLVLMSMAMFIIVIDTTIMNVSISALVVDLNTSVAGIQAAISIYALVMASFILIGGKLADLFGRKRVFIVGIIIFGIGTTIASFSQSLGVLIFGWSILEGIGSAMMLPNTQTILRGAYSGAARATAYGTVSAVGAIGAALGPIVGGLLTTYASWRWAFRLEVIIVVAVLVLRHYIPKDAEITHRPRFDFFGAVLSVFGWSSIVLGILAGQTYGFWFAKQPLVIGSFEIAPFGLSVTPFLVGIGLLLIFGLFHWEGSRERSGKSGLFRTSLFRLEGITSGFFVRFIQMALMASFLFLVPLLFQLTFAFSAVQTGLALMPYSIGVLIFAIVGARLSSRYAARTIIRVGFVIAIIGLVMLAATIQPDARPEDLALGFVFGVGMGLVASQILNLVLSSGPERDTAEIAGLNGTFEQLGNSIGVALLGAVMITALAAGMQQGVQDSTTLPAEAKVELSAAIDESIALMNDAQVSAALDAAGVEDAAAAEIEELYATERTNAFQIAVVFLIFVSAAGLIATNGLARRKLVTAPGDDEQQPEAAA